MGGSNKNTTSSSKVNFSLSKKKKKNKEASKEATDPSLTPGSVVPSKKETKKITFNADDNDQYTTTAEAASIETKRRKELGIELVIPLKSEEENGKKKEPLLSGLKRIINGENDEDPKEKGNSTGGSSSDNNKDEINEEAEDALIQMASENQKDKQNYDSTTNFSSRGSSLVIQQQRESGVKITKKNSSESDALKYQRDMKHRAEDVSVDSKAYVNIPISEFGAAMLRGMGWKSKDSNDDKKKDKEFNPRPHRLGLGATPLPPSMKKDEIGKGSNNSSKRHWAKKGGTMGDRAKIEKEEEEERRWKMKMEEKKKNDIQITLQIGSIVRVRNEDDDDDLQGMRRARMIKIAGVPGLNRVLVRYEGESADVSVKKGDVLLVSKSDLEMEPFREKSSEKSSENDRNQRKSKQSSREVEEKDRNSRSPSRSRSRSRSRERKRSKKDRRRERSHSRERTKRHKTSKGTESDDESNYGKSKRDKDRSRDRKKQKRSDEKREDKRRRDNGYDSAEGEGDESRKRKKSKRESETSFQKSTEHWLTPNIRVRVVTKKIAKGRQYKQKGVVMDVLNHGTYAVVHMDNGELIERVPERYLETALPKVGGNAIILTGPNQFSKGKLLERNSSKGKGIIQLFEDMNVVTLGLDDMAEWCGSLDDEYID